MEGAHVLDEATRNRGMTKAPRSDRFQNPAGKQKGTQNKLTRALVALLEGEGEALTRKAIELAKEADIAALRLCIVSIASFRLAGIVLCRSIFRISTAPRTSEASPCSRTIKIPYATKVA
jgi:hypothetical protein